MWPLGTRVDIPRLKSYQWEFQDPKMEAPHRGHMFGLDSLRPEKIGLIYARYLHIYIYI